MAFGIWLKVHHTMHKIDASNTDTIREKIIQFVLYVAQFQNPVISKNMRLYDFQKCSKKQHQAIQHGQSLIKIFPVLVRIRVTVPAIIVRSAAKCGTGSVIQSSIMTNSAICDVHYRNIIYKII